MTVDAGEASVVAGEERPVGRSTGSAGPAPPQTPRHRLYRRGATRWLRRFGALAALVILFAVTAGLNSNFATQSSIYLLLQGFCLSTALIGVGQTLVILTGGIDLSVGALLAVGSALTGTLVGANVALPLAMALPIIVTTALGALSGGIIATARIQPIVVTLAMMIAVRGLAQLVAGDATLRLNNDAFNAIATTRVGLLPWLDPVPVSLLLTALVYGVAALFLARTALGRYVFAVGGNERAVVLSGVAAGRVKVLVYAVSGLLAGATGVLYASYNATADPFNDGTFFELTSIAAVVVGGTSLLGGVGGVWRTLVGGLILTVLFALLIQIGWPTQTQLIAQGLIIAGAVILQGGGEER